MATADGLKKITEARIQSFNNLKSAEDWFWCSYTMAMALECALKAMVCKTLNLGIYPESSKKKIVDFFYTHTFEQLLIASGLSQTFQSTAEIFQNWSDFTKEFSGEWVESRYSYERQQQFDKIKVELLYKNLMDPTNGLIMKIKEKW